MRVFVTKSLRRFQRKEGIKDAALSDAVERAEHGLIAADLGGGLIKQRVARAGGGKSGGFRTIIAYRAGWRAFFIFDVRTLTKVGDLSAKQIQALRERAGVVAWHLIVRIRSQ